MSLFWLGLLCVLALLFVVVPLLRGRRLDDDVDRGELLRQLHTQRVAEVSEQSDPELQQALNDEMASVLLAEHAENTEVRQAEGGGVQTVNPGPFWLLLLAVPLVAGLVFVGVTDTGLARLRGAEAVMTLSVDEQAAEIQRWQEILHQRVTDQPEDSKSWYLLGHARLKVSDYAGAAEAFAVTHSLTGDDLTVQIYWLQSRYLAARGVLDSVSQKLAEDILQAQPDNPVVLEILALHAFSQNDKAGAVTLLNRAINGARDPVQQASFGRAIEQIRKDMENPPAGVTVNVGVAQAHIGQIPHGGAVFVIARPVGGGMPYAVVRRPALLMPLTVYLDDLVSMSPNRKLSEAEAFEVVVRMSRTGNAMPQAGDWQWQSGELALSSAQGTALTVELVPP